MIYFVVLSVCDNAKAGHESEKKKRTKHLHESSQVEMKARHLEYRNKYVNVHANYSQESDDSSKAWDFEKIEDAATPF